MFTTLSNGWGRGGERCRLVPYIFCLYVSSNIDTIHHLVIFNTLSSIYTFGEGYLGLSSLAPIHISICSLLFFTALLYMLIFLFVFHCFVLLTILIYVVCLPFNFIFFVLASWTSCSSFVDVKQVLKYYFISNSKSF